MNESKLSAAAGKHSIEPHEISKIASILEIPEVKEAVLQAEEARKTKTKAMLFAFVGTYAACFALFTFVESSIPFAARALISVFPSLIAMGIAHFATKGEQGANMKKAVLSKFFEIFSPGASYSPGSAFSPPYAHLVAEGFLSSYDKVDREEDSFSFRYVNNGRGISVSGMELETSEMRGSGKNRRRVTTNKCVLMRGDYPDTRFDIEKSVRISGDMADSMAAKLLSFGIPAGFAWIWLGGEKGRAVIEALSGVPYVQEFAALAVGIAGWLIVGWITNHNRVKLENVRFEKLFDVKSEDQIVSRMLLTPALMDRMVEFVNKTGGRNVRRLNGFSSAAAFSRPASW